MDNGFDPRSLVLEADQVEGLGPNFEVLLVVDIEVCIVLLN
jgi:hypothetical protein